MRTPANGTGVVVHCFRGERYLGSESVDAPADHIAARKVLALQPPADKGTIAACDYDLRTVLAQRQPAATSAG